MKPSTTSHNLMLEETPRHQVFCECDQSGCWRIFDTHVRHSHIHWIDACVFVKRQVGSCQRCVGGCRSCFNLQRPIMSPFIVKRIVTRHQSSVLIDLLYPAQRSHFVFISTFLKCIYNDNKTFKLIQCVFYRMCLRRIISIGNLRFGIFGNSSGLQAASFLIR